MGRRLNTSTPTVIQTMLTPLSDSFSIKESDALEQWFYANTGEYSPDRAVTPLRLRPNIVAVDENSQKKYTPSFSSVVWYYFDATNTTDYSSDPMWPGLGWVRVTAVEPTTGGVPNDYYCPTTSNPTFDLFVQKNVQPADVGMVNAGQAICCVARYIDPRDSGTTIEVRDNVLMVTHKYASSNILNIEIFAPTKTSFNVLDGTVSTYKFEAQVLNDAHEDVTADYYIEWSGKVNGSTTEQSIDTLLCYKKATQVANKGQGTNIITVDAMYAEHLDLVCRIRETMSSPVLPFVAYAGLVWEYPKVDATTICKNGRVVNSMNRKMTFATIVNYRGGVLSDAVKQANILFNYKYRISSSSTYQNMGWGQEITVDSDTLKQTSTYSSPVHSEVYMLGAYDYTTDDGEVVTDDNEEVYDRL